MAVGVELRIPTTGPLYLKRTAAAEALDGRAYAQICPPAAHTGPRPVAARLISARLRAGLEHHVPGEEQHPVPWSPGLPMGGGGGKTAVAEPASPSLLFHCHGGGFVASSPRSHESYLRYWARHLDCPILSIDYSLAPENPFPRFLTSPSSAGGGGRRKSIAGRWRRSCTPTFGP